MEPCNSLSVFNGHPLAFTDTIALDVYLSILLCQSTQGKASLRKEFLQSFPPLYNKSKEGKMLLPPSKPLLCTLPDDDIWATTLCTLPQKFTFCLIIGRA
jgi:hypothetical protein